jgi:sulfotransferase family protein
MRIGRSQSRKIEKLDFIVAGAQKSGTTALHYFLEQHPQIALPDKQELHFFDDEDLFAKGANYDLLHDSFKPTRNSVVAGENTPAYIYWKPSIERIWNYNKQIKLILLLRNPIERAFSHWNMQRERGFDALDFLDAIRAEADRQREALPFQSRRFSYVDRGLYSVQLERVFKFFPREQIKVIKFEDFRKEQSATMTSIFRFIGVESWKNIRNKERNPIRYQREITDKESRFLYDLFKSDIDQLEKLLDWDCSDWKL